MIRAHESVRPEALDEASRRIRRLLSRCPAIQANLAAAGAELHVLGEHQAVSDLPMYRHLAGKPFEGTLTIDERGRGYGGLHSCCSEEALLSLPSARHRDHRDICAHEVAHAVLDYGLDASLRALLEARHAEIARSGLWGSAYASTSAAELFAEASMWWVGSRGDYGDLPSPEPGQGWLSRHDPETFLLLDALYQGRLAPQLASWCEAEPSTRDRSRSGEIPTQIVFCNETPRPLTLFWRGYDGRAVPYGAVAPEAVRAQQTWVSHVWDIFDPQQRSLGRFVAGLRPSRFVAREP